MPRDEPLQATAPLDSPAAFTTFEKPSDTTDFFTHPHPHLHNKSLAPHLRRSSFLASFSTSEASLSPSLPELEEHDNVKVFPNPKVDFASHGNKVVDVAPGVAPNGHYQDEILVGGGLGLGSGKLDHQPTSQPPLLPTLPTSRRASLDPSRFPGPFTDSDDAIASAAEEMTDLEFDQVVDKMGLNVGSAPGLDAREEMMERDQGDEMLDEIEERLRREDGGMDQKREYRVRVFSKDGQEHPSLGESDDLNVADAVDAAPASAPDDDEVYRMGVSTRDTVRSAPDEGKRPVMVDVGEEDEDDWEVGLRRQEHSSEFQDDAGLDFGDEMQGKADDDEGMDPMENM